MAKDRTVPVHRPIGWWRATLFLLGGLGMLAAWPRDSLAARVDRSGSEVVATVCARCHATGELGAPRIGDEKAWAARAAQGLSALTAHALAGIRNMPAHGGNPGLSDVEIGRAITQMVNRSGGHWVEPIDPAMPATERRAEQIVQGQCAQCHRDGVGGAPKIGDRAAWIPRMNNGVDPLVRSAAHGHGGMPPRGGVADLNDAELRSAVLYMFNYGVVMPAAAAQAPGPASPYHKVAGSAEVYLGILPARSMREGQPAGKVPSGRDYYHLNVSLLEVGTGRPIGDARVKVQVGDGLSVETMTLEPMAANGAPSYGAYFKMPGPNPYTIDVTIRRPGVSGETHTQFEFRPG